LEKLGGFVAMVVSIAVLAIVSWLNLPVFITAPLVAVCVMIYIGGVVLLVAEGQILRDRGGKRTPKVC
jgi:hypothetical protein